jgi:hypothetical protein
VADPRKVLLLPWHLKLNAHNHVGILLDGLTEGILKSGSYDSVISYYDPQSWPASAALSRTAPEISLSRVWPDRSSGVGPDAQEICRIGRMLGVGVAVTGAWRVPPAPVDIDSEGIELYFIDIESGQVFTQKDRESISIYHGDFKPYLIGLVKKLIKSYSPRNK